MDVVVLVKSIVGLIALLGILIFFFFYSPFEKKKKKSSVEKKSIKKQVKKDAFSELKSLAEVIKNRNSSTQELEKALDMIIKYHGKIHKKLGIRAHPDFDIYADIIFRICRHPNTTKELIINFDRELEERNPEYKKEINDALTKGLNSRGF